MNDKEIAVYNKAVQRLRRTGKKDPTSQIVALEEEIDRYRERIMELMAAQEKAEKIRRSELYQHPYIELRPTCSKCGAVQPIPKCSYRTEYFGRGVDGYVAAIDPPTCHNCGAFFENIVFQGVLPSEEAQP